MIRVHVNVERVRANQPAIVVLVGTAPPLVCREIYGPGWAVKQAYTGERRPDGCPHVWFEMDSRVYGDTFNGADLWLHLAGSPDDRNGANVRLVEPGLFGDGDLRSVLFPPGVSRGKGSEP